ncbi:hypothetical protein [Salinicoccus albus]|uniref:hypothetical protein n=1 Tax=Salinicoccus albus TaxID=418756 RepID=UPI000368E0CA|nr:hypothetical protein [Salinicoccus albus]
MKRLIYLILPIIVLSACGGNSPKQELAEAEERNKELESMLQTEEVNLQKNQMRLEALEEDISKMQSVIGNSDIDTYVSEVSEYSSALKEEVEKLDGLVKEAKESEDLSIISEDIGDIRENIDEAMNRYQSAAEALELNDYLKREHSSLELANEEISDALDNIENGADSSTMEAVNEGTEQLKSASEYY